jgi:hypothetical protein
MFKKILITKEDITMSIQRDKDQQRPGNPDRKSQNNAAYSASAQGQDRDRPQQPQQPRQPK